MDDGGRNRGKWSPFSPLRAFCEDIWTDVLARSFSDAICAHSGRPAARILATVANVGRRRGVAALLAGLRERSFQFLFLNGQKNTPHPLLPARSNSEVAFAWT